MNTQKILGYFLIILVVLVTIVSLGTRRTIGSMKKITVLLLFLMVYGVTYSQPKLYGTLDKKYFSKTEVINDLNIILNNIKSVSPLYNEAIEKKIVLKKDKFINTIKDSVSTIEFYYKIEEIIAILKDNHSLVRGILADKCGLYKDDDKVFPLLLHFKNNKAYIDYYYSSKELTNAELLEINGHSIKEILEKISKLYDYKTFLEWSLNNYFTDIRSVDEFSKLLRHFNIKSPFTIKYRKNNLTDIHTIKLDTTTTRPNLRWDMKVYNSKKKVQESNEALEFYTQKEGIDYLKIQTFIPKTILFRIVRLMGMYIPTISKRKYLKYLRIISKNNNKNLIVDLRGNLGGYGPLAHELLKILIKGNYGVQDQSIRASLFKDFPERTATLLNRQIPESFNISKSKAKEITKKLFLEAQRCNYKDNILLSSAYKELEYVNHNKKKIDKNIYFLIDANIASATIELMDLIKYYKLGLIIGEETKANIGVTAYQYWVYNRNGMDIRIRGGAMLPMDNKYTPLDKFKPNIYYNKDSIVDYTIDLIKKGINIHNYQN